MSGGTYVDMKDFLARYLCNAIRVSSIGSRMSRHSCAAANYCDLIFLHFKKDIARKNGLWKRDFCMNSSSKLQFDVMSEAELEPVLELLEGGDPDVIALKAGITREQLFQMRDDFFYIINGKWINASKRFIKEHECRIRHQCPRYFKPASFSPGQDIGLLGCQVVDSEFLQHLIGLCFLLRSV